MNAREMYEDYDLVIINNKMKGFRIREQEKWELARYVAFHNYRKAPDKVYNVEKVQDVGMFPWDEGYEKPVSHEPIKMSDREFEKFITGRKR